MKKKLPVSVVCASHNGRDKIPKLIKSIYYNTHWPSEIIICGTKNEDFELIKGKYKKLPIKTLVSEIKNQTTQRKIAIDRSKNNILIQLDDDLELDRNYIYLMHQHFKYNPNIKKIVSAAILFKNKKHQAIRWNNAYQNSGLLRNILHFLNCGMKLKNMSILKSGRIVPKLPSEFLKNNNKGIVKDIEWVCSTVAYNKKYIKDSITLQIRNNLKAFYEDVFFSHSLFRMGYKLIIDRSIIAYHPPTIQTNFSTFIKTIPSQLKIVITFNKSLTLFFLDVIIFSIIHGLLDLTKMLKYYEK